MEIIINSNLSSNFYSKDDCQCDDECRCDCYDCGCNGADCTCNDDNSNDDCTYFEYVPEDECRMGA